MSIIKCKYCGGAGKTQGYLMEPPKACPTCSGAGEFVIEGPLENLTPCKLCGETGKTQTDFFMGVKPCDACKGLGLIERPRIKLTTTNGVVVDHGVPRPSRHQFDIAISFAGENRQIAAEYADKLKAKGISVFYDDFEKASLWGKDLYERLDEVYRQQARFCVIFISKAYADKLWTNHERKSAQARAFKENREYILPVRLDDTELPGIRETIGYLDMRRLSVDELVRMTVKKLGQK